MLAGVAIAAPAQAAAYRYWGYFHLEKGAWAFAQTGAAESVPKDGSIEGWRFAVADESSMRTPRATPTFDSLCASTRVKAGTKRVGLVIDYGRPADSADGTQPPAVRATCVAVPEKATGSDVLVAAGATLRLEKGLTCGIDGWPAAGCGPAVDPVPAAAASPDTDVTIPAPTPSAAANAAGASSGTSTDDGSTGANWPVFGGLAALVLVGGLGFAAWRRSRDTTED
jgi:LPXTG-motif cell wall-anchored protein